MNEKLLNSFIAPLAHHFSFLKHEQYVIFWGGTDINPELYGEKPSPYTQIPDKYRDNIETQQALYCIKNNIPIIGICRGA